MGLKETKLLIKILFFIFILAAVVFGAYFCIETYGPESMIGFGIVGAAICGITYLIISSEEDEKNYLDL